MLLCSNNNVEFTILSRFYYSGYNLHTYSHCHLRLRGDCVHKTFKCKVRLNNIMEVPVSKKTYYKQRYKSEWEANSDFKLWLKAFPGDPTRAFCTYCNRDIAAKLSDIQRHSKSTHHLNKCKPVLDKSQSKICTSELISKDSSTQETEAALSMFIAEHSAFAVVDHLTELCIKRFFDSRSVKNLKLHRTKCTSIIKEVLAPHFIDELKVDIDGNSYSLIIDESTDISVKKCLGVVVKYYSLSSSKTISTFLGLVELDLSTAESIVNALINLLVQCKLNLNQLTGIGTDNAAVMTGANSGVYKMLKENYSLPNLILIRCVCHSIQLAVSHASVETIPRNIEFLLRETYNGFQISSKRQLDYAELYQTINPGEEPLKILKTCDTRWLSIKPAVMRILGQWDELKLHFDLTRLKENCFKAELLYAMFNDQQNKLYLTFLQGILDNVQKAVKTFESKTSDPCLLYNTLIDLIKSLCLRIIISQPRMEFESINVREYMSLSPYLGYLFEKELTDCSLNANVKKAIKQRCVDFIVKLIHLLQQRLPENMKVLKNSMCMSVSIILKENRTIQNLINLVEGLGEAENMDDIVQEWNSIILQSWKNTTDTELFWAEVSQSKDAAGNCPYKKLFGIATKVMSLPHSNADIERVFSTMNVVKTKLRNSLNIDTINAILHVRLGLAYKKSTCFNYIVPDKILSQLGSNKKYTWKLKKTQEPEPGPSGIRSNVEISQPDIEIE